MHTCTFVLCVSILEVGKNLVNHKRNKGTWPKMVLFSVHHILWWWAATWNLAFWFKDLEHFDIFLLMSSSWCLPMLWKALRPSEYLREGLVWTGTLHLKTWELCISQRIIFDALKSCGVLLLTAPIMRFSGAAGQVATFWIYLEDWKNEANTRWQSKRKALELELAKFVEMFKLQKTVAAAGIFCENTGAKTDNSLKKAKSFRRTTKGNKFWWWLWKKTL